MADQGLAAGTHLVVHVLSARWMPPDVYGGFAIVFTLYQIAHIAHSAILTEPMLVFGASRYRASWASYFSGLVRTQSKLLLGASVAGGVVGFTVWMSGGGALGTQLAAAAPALVGMLFLALVRRRAYVERRPAVAAIASGVYLAVSTGVLVALGRGGGLAPWMVWASLGSAGLTAAVSVGVFRAGDVGASAPLDVRAVMTAHWSFGRWLLVSGLLGFLVSGLSPWLVGAFHGLVAVGTYRAVLNLALPGLQASAALTVLALPYLAGLEPEEVRGRWLRLSGLLGTAFAVYAAAVALLGGWLMDGLYGSGSYEVGWAAIVLAGALPLMYLPLGLGGVLLKARGRPREFTVGSVATGVLGLLVGVPLIAQQGPVGALAAAGLAYLVGGSFVSFYGLRITAPTPSRLRSPSGPHDGAGPSQHTD